MIIHECEQGTPEWFELRRGKFTASEFDKLFMGKTTKGYNDYINQIVYERLTGEIAEGFENEWMRRGKEFEPEAREAYEFETFTKVNQVGFIELDEWTGYSPDGLIGEDGDLEIKCPKFTTWMNYRLFPDNFYKDHIYQVQGGLWISGRKYLELRAYHPRLGLTGLTVKPDEHIFSALIKEIGIAKRLVQERIKIIRGN